MATPNFLEQDWCGLTWSPWVPFHAPRRRGFREIPTAPGVYRARVKGQDVLAYVGQTKRRLRERIMALTLHTLAAEMPWNDPHTAAPSLWSYRDAEGMEFECSAAPVSMCKSDRQGLECYLLWQYRLAQGSSTLCNFGRLHPSYRKSRDRSTGDRGGRLPGGAVNSSHAPSHPPLQPHGVPVDGDWMGLMWSEPKLLEKTTLRDVPRKPGVYKILDGRAAQLLYVGEAQDLADRLRGHLASSRFSPGVRVSCCSLPELSVKCQRLEVENDLIGACYGVSGRSPSGQFGAS